MLSHPVNKPYHSNKKLIEQVRRRQILIEENEKNKIFEQDNQQIEPEPESKTKNETGLEQNENTAVQRVKQTEFIGGK